MRKILKAAPIVLGSLLLLLIVCSNIADDEITTTIPVLGATSSDWDKASYWHYPWGESIVHKGIDIFKPEHTHVIASRSGIVIHSAYNGNGGNFLYIIGSDFRIYYYAHLSKRIKATFQIVKEGELVGLVGDTGNAVFAPYHLHFSVFSPAPIFRHYDSSKKMGWKRMFYLDPARYFKTTEE